MANKLFAAFKRDILKDAVAVDLAVTAGLNAGIGVILTTKAISDSQADDPALEDMLDLDGGVVFTGTIGASDTYSGSVGTWLCETGEMWLPSTAASTGLQGSVNVVSGRAVFDIGSDPVFSSVNSTSNATIKTVLVVLLKTGGIASDSRLLAKFDTGTGLPLTDPGGADVTVVWDNGDAKVFRI